MHGNLRSDKGFTGVDEVGRGCFAGPIVAAAVTLPFDSKLLLDDSKKLSEPKRHQLERQIRKEAVSISIQALSSRIVDERGIDWCNWETMNEAIRGLKPRPQHFYVDGNRFVLAPDLHDLDYECVPGGDGKILAISAASIIAKNFRDRLMKDLHHEFPMYGWNTNVGYGSKKHIEAIKKHGLTEHHRKSFIHFL